LRELNDRYPDRFHVLSLERNKGKGRPSVKEYYERCLMNPPLLATGMLTWPPP
jgi:hypothetical protein